MQDYYYILGVSPSSSADEIKAAYKKLAPKFHPDKNGGDPFFTERFKEIQQAYDTLSNSEKRKEYDVKRSSFRQQNQHQYANNFAPEVEYFRTSSPFLEYDVEITFSWKTINADLVTIKPFGNVPPIGSKTVKFKDFKNPSLTFELIAENSRINKITNKSLTVYNKTYRELSEHFKNDTSRNNIPSKNNNDEEKTDNSVNNQALFWAIVFAITFIALSLFLVKAG